MKKIPNKNYVILGFIILITVLLVFYARNIYIAARQYNLSNSPMLKVINEINEGEINNYLLENPRFILYVASKNNSDIKSFEKKLKKYVIEKELSGNMVYLNSDNVDKKIFNDQIKTYSASEKIKNRINIDEHVSMCIFDNGKITHVIKNADQLTIKQIDTLLESNGMLDD